MRIQYLHTKITPPISQILSANIVKFVLTNVCPESPTLILMMVEIHHYQNKKTTVNVTQQYFSHKLQINLL